MKKRLGIQRDTFAKPVLYGLQEGTAKGFFDLFPDIPAQLALKLRQNELDGAFVSPIDFARDYTYYSLIPGAAVASEGASETVFLLFKEHLSRIETVAADLTSSSEIVLATLILAEKYNCHIQIVPHTHPPGKMLASVDALLVRGDAAFPHTEVGQKLDLVDEWSDITGLPYVHAVWAAREESLNRSEVEKILESAREGERALDTLAPKEFPDYLHQFDYSLNESAVAGLTEFYRMAYYHGILPDIPDVTFYRLPELPS